MYKIDNDNPTAFTKPISTIIISFKTRKVYNIS